ncbi:venom acid phosphatase Acph-1-like [Belonocnema kinseyi]|uniref:venom acid phosphatase Acph-1-like n=1 Tax=Belonocnema kinseyi TaxID=2817044 RepID=UPI00143CC476|nr:venom acid phosphatase Acph-1-like [Belonocnema kinseyi]
MKASFFLLFALSVQLVSVARCDLQLKMLHVLFRHGDKVPHKEYQNYPNDPHRNHSFLPIDNGGLTNLGMMREYKIGTMLRERYDGYFGPDYWPSLIYAQSTDLPRTKMSLQLVLAGLFPPSELQTWNQNLPWIPVDISYVPAEEDYLLFTHHCPQYKREYKSFLHGQEAKQVLTRYKHVLDYLTAHSGKKVQDTGSVYYLYNLLKEEAAQNLTLPKWTEKVFPSPMKDITALDFNLRSFTTALRRLNGGLILRHITDGMKAIREGKLDPPSRKAFFFSAHELNVVALSRTLGLEDPALPSYGSTFILETLQDEKKEYFVRVLFWTGVTEKLIPQTISGCKDICPLDEFLNLLKDVIPSDEEYYCYGTKASKACHTDKDASSVAASQGPIYSLLLAILPLTLRL